MLSIEVVIEGVLACLIGTITLLNPSHIRPAAAVSAGRLDKLTRDELLALDNEVSQFYVDSYAELDRKNTTFEDQLYRAIRSLRHTTIANHFDFRYTDNETVWRSIGAQVDRELCRSQLSFLARIVEATSAGKPHSSFANLPLSVIDFLGASAQPGSGVLNGNFAWLGSAASCEHARIGADIVARYGGQQLDQDVLGRYCAAHLRAKSWPKWDTYFEDRITLRRGLCLPRACHTALYLDDDQIRQLVDVVALGNLLPPYGDPDRYEVSYLYCLPDEDSPFRQPDLGAKLFILFISFWLLLVVWANIKYSQRRTTMRQLRDTVDIRMIINDGETDEGETEASAPSGAESSRPEQAEAQKTGGNTNLLGGSAGGPASNCSSAAVTPLPSDVDENDSDVNLIEPFKGSLARQRRKAKKCAYDRDRRQDEGEPVDFAKALSLEANLKFLFFRPRPNFVRTDQDVPGPGATGQQQEAGGGGVRAGRQSASKKKRASVSRRSSNTRVNEALVKELQDGSGESNVAIVSGEGEGEREREEVRGRRVTIEILDGLKVIATSYIVYGHTMMFFFGCVNDLRFAVERMFDITMIVTLNTLQIVGLFYVITGCLLTYFSFSKTKLKQLVNPIFWLLVLIGRYFRLIPTYALVFWFARHVAPYTGAGRDWYDYRTDGEHARGFCGQESWWIMWTMSAADVKIPNDCVPQAWYLSDDFRTLMVLPVYVFLLAYSSRLGYAAIFATFAGSIWKLSHILKEANIDYKIVLNWHPHVYALMADRLHDVYTDFLVRMSTYLLGVIVGHLLYLYEIRYIRRWPAWFTRYGMKLALAVACCFFFGAHIIANPLVNQFLPRREEVDSNTVVWLIPLFKSSMELAICVILLLLVTGGGNKLVRQLLASQPMKILSNISYAVFLIHIELMYKMPASQFESNYWYLVLYSGFFIAFSHVFAFFLYLLWEMPINNLTRNLFKRAFRALS